MEITFEDLVLSIISKEKAELVELIEKPEVESFS